MTGVGPAREDAVAGGRRPLGRGSLGVSVAVHVVALVVVFVVIPALQPETLFYRVVEIDMVAAAPVPVEELIVETPDEPEPAPEAPAVVEEAPEPDSVESPPEEEPEPAPEPIITSSTEEPRAGDDEVTVRIEGFRRDFPEYYENITNQIRRCFRTSETAYRPVVVRFVIHLDGSVTDIDAASSSGNRNFDIDAMGAIECAGRAGRLGTLPPEYRWDVLPIDFTISPKG